MKNTILSAFFIFLTTLLAGQSVAIDSTFGVNGVVKTSLYHVSTNTIVGVNMSVLPDGKIIAGGEKDDKFTMQKFEPNGEISPDFSSPDPNFSGYKIGTFIQKDGNVIACGTNKLVPNDVCVIRFDQSGAVDSTFGIGGIASTGFKHVYFSNLLEQADSKIVVFGAQDLGTGASSLQCKIARFNPDGRLDSTFAADGKFIYDANHNEIEFLNAGVQQPDGKLLFAGMGSYRFLMVRLDTNGSLDSTFHGDGIMKQTSFFAWADAMALQPDGKIVLIGDSDGAGIIARYKPNGSLDSAFAMNGVRLIPETYEGVAVAMKPDGKILAALKAEAGDDVVVVLAQLLPNGQLDPAFGDQGLFISDILMRSRTLELWGNKAIVGGQTTDYGINIARFLLDLSVGTINPAAPADPTLWVYPNPVADQFSLDFGLSQRADVRIQLYDTQGKLVQTMMQEQTYETGDHQANLQLETPIPAGVYVLCLEIAGSPHSSIQIVKR